MNYENWVSRLKYKPDWFFFYFHDEWGPWLQISAKVPHSTTLEFVEFRFNRMIPELPDEKLFKSWVRSILKEAELHELDEFLRFDGELVNDPHAVIPVG